MEANTAALPIVPTNGSHRGLSVFTFWISGMLLLTISLMVTVDVFARYVLLSPIPGVLEIERMLMPYVCFCAFAYAFVEGSHVRVTLITDKLGPRTGRVNEIVADLIGLAGCAIITAGAWMYFWESARINEVMSSGADFWIPMWLGKLGFPIGLTMFSFVLLRKLWRTIRNGA